MNYDQDPYERQKAYAESMRNGYLNPSMGGPAVSPGLVSERVEGGVIRSVRRMEKQLMELSATVETLCERLSMVRIPCPSSTQGVDKAPEGSSLATQLSAYNQVLECQTARLQQLIQELDL
jgi:hypothetical protein